MSNSKRRAWCMSEITAHTQLVNCVAVGRQSSRVLATGGDDRKVNLWTVNGRECVMSLSGHTSAVESVLFGRNDDLVAAGSRSGVLKIWDLEQVKLLKTFAGHKSAIGTVAFYPYGESFLVATGSQDTNIKLWDFRRKTCIYTYKEHVNSVNSVKFSPDGRWLVSAGDDQTVKFFDLTAGKLLSDLKGHSGPVACIEFHPKEYLLATGSADRTVRFWELETFSQISSSDFDCSSAIRTLNFHPDGECLYAGAQDLLKVYSWEPMVCLDSVSTSWGKVCDASVTVSNSSQLVAASTYQQNISVHVVQLQLLAPFTQPPAAQNRPLTQSGRRNFHVERPRTQCSRVQHQTREHSPAVGDGSGQSDANDNDDGAAVIKNRQGYDEIFKSRHRIRRSPGRVGSTAGERNEQPISPPPTARPQPDKMPSSSNSVSSTHKNAENLSSNVKSPPRRDRLPPVEKPPAVAAAAAPAAAGFPTQPQVQVEDFVPSSKAIAAQKDEVMRSRVADGHTQMVAALRVRANNVAKVRSLMCTGKLRGALELAVSLNDQSILVDVLNLVNAAPSVWDLSICAELVPSIRDLLSSKYETFVTVACTSIKLILKHFVPVIRSSMHGAAAGIGVDLSAEDRRQRARSCYNVLVDCRTEVDRLQNVPAARYTPKMLSLFREVKILLQQLD